MKSLLITVLSMCSLVFTYNYDVGEYISLEHQNIVKNTCYSGNEYEVGDDWKLADWNGAENGGFYTVIFIDMAATW